MKKIFALAVIFISSSLIINAQSVEEILQKTEEALGGREALTNIKTLQYSSTIKMNVMGQGFDISVTHTKEQGKLYRRETAGMMGMKGSYSLLTDTALYVSTPSIPSFGDFPGMEGGIKKMEKEALLAAQNQLDCAGYFPSLIQYKEKGNKAELLGKAKVNKKECYKIKLTQANMQETVYYIDAVSYLIIQSETQGKAAAEQFGMGAMMEQFAAKASNLKVTVIYSDYKEFGKVKFPAKETLQVGANDIEIENVSFLINDIISKDFYKAN